MRGRIVAFKRIGEELGSPLHQNAVPVKHLTYLTPKEITSPMRHSLILVLIPSEHGSVTSYVINMNPNHSSPPDTLTHIFTDFSFIFEGP